MKLFTQWVLKYRWMVVILTLGLTGFFAWQMPKMSIDNSIDNMLPADHPAKQAYDKVSETFGSTDILVVALHSDSLFSPSVLDQIYEITYEFEAVSGVTEVRSISTANYMRGSEFGLEVEDLMPEPPKRQADIDSLRQKIDDSDIYTGTIISENREYAGFIIRLAPEADDATVYRGIQSVIRSQPNNDDFSIAGAPAVNTVMADSMKHDLTTLLPFVILLVLLSLYFSFRSLQGVLLPVLTVLISVIWTLGLMALLSIPMAMISTILPILLVAIGSAYGIHAINGYYEELVGDQSKAEAITGAMAHVGKAILMAGLTTLIGFAALATSQVTQVQQFGLFTAFGVASALILSITFIPAILMTLPVPKNINARDNNASPGLLDRQLEGLAKFTLRHKKMVIITGALLLLLSVAGFPWLFVETNTLRFFKPESEIRQATAVINQHFGGSENLSLYIQGDIKSPAVLNQMLEIQEYAESLDHVGYSISIADYVAEINKALNNNAAEFRTIPATRDAVAQEILLYTMSGDPSDFEQVVDYDYRQANVSIRMESVGSSELGTLVEDIEEYTASHADSMSVEVTGSSYLFKVLTDLLVRGQIWSLITSLGLVWLVIALIFRSIAAGGFSIIPLTLTIAINFGLMGWFGIPLDTATTMLASMAIGIGVDYSIHFLSRYKLEVERTGDYDQAAILTTQTTGKAIFFNAVAVSMGFIALLFSSFRPIQVLGGLTVFTMVTASAGALTILPAVLSKFQPKFLGKPKTNTQEE
ncbi:MAG: MMPL family transporter [Candidatus Marinimicrobia bacterium]|nr:MMPL family transporter [Candidatus Neomarinimicrobiota bacterium]MCF7829290.1 MMPL family transporter [Candidatus Neomarinimicrobiota bacterium]MCF7880048.1 MMPL family transporter [Candidatus Neomarinimicrobiota bacterium]